MFGDEGLGATACAAQRPEGDGVAARLGREVAAEAEHVHPLAEQRIRPVAVPVAVAVADGLGAPGEVSGAGPQPGVVGAGGGAGVGGGLGGVLGQVAGDLLGGEGSVGVVGAAAGAHGAGVELAAEREDPGGVVLVDTRHGQPHRGRGLADEVGEDGRGEGCGGGGEPVRALGAVEADQGVEVDHAALLVLGDLGVLHGGVLGEPGRRARAGSWRPGVAGRW